MYMLGLQLYTSRMETALQMTIVYGPNQALSPANPFLHHRLCKGFFFLGKECSR